MTNWTISDIEFLYCSSPIDGDIIYQDNVSCNDDINHDKETVVEVDVARRVFRPGVTAAQLRLQPGFVLMASVWKKICTLLVLVTMIGGRK